MIIVDRLKMKMTPAPKEATETTNTMQINKYVCRFETIEKNRMQKHEWCIVKHAIRAICIVKHALLLLLYINGVSFPFFLCSCRSYSWPVCISAFMNCKTESFSPHSIWMALSFRLHSRKRETQNDSCFVICYTFELHAWICEWVSTWVSVFGIRYSSIRLYQQIIWFNVEHLPKSSVVKFWLLHRKRTNTMNGGEWPLEIWPTAIWCQHNTHSTNMQCVHCTARESTQTQHQTMKIRWKILFFAQFCLFIASKLKLHTSCWVLAFEMCTFVESTCYEWWIAGTLRECNDLSTRTKEIACHQ